MSGKIWRKGSSIIELLGAMAILGFVISFAARQGDETAKMSYATALAHQLNNASKAAQNYLDANSSQILEELKDSTGRDHLFISQNGVTDNLGQPVTMTGKAADGLDAYMPVQFNHTRYGQNVAMYAYKGADGSIHGLLTTTGGRQANNAKEKLAYLPVARQASGMNGFGMFVEKSVKGSDVNTLVGPNDSWRFVFDDEDYGNVPRDAFTEGQLARPLYAYASAIKDDLLYRVEIEGHPELNAMQTDLHLNGNTITDVGTLTISQAPAIQGSSDTAEVPPGGNGLVIEPYNTNGDIADSAQLVCDGAGGPAKPNGFIFTVSNPATGGQDENDLNGIWTCLNGKARLISDSQNSTSTKAVALLKHNETIAKPKCPQGTTPAIFVSEAAFAEKKDKPGVVVAVQSYALDEGDKWRISIRLKTTNQKNDNEWVSPTANADGSQYNFVVAHTACQRDLSI